MLARGRERGSWYVPMTWELWAEDGKPEAWEPCPCGSGFFYFRQAVSSLTLGLCGVLS